MQIGPRNSFISLGGTKKEADIWIVPNSDPKSWGVNSGQGTIIGDNKFGNEHRDTDKPRILIALEDQASGSDRLSRQHSTTVAPGQGHYVTGVKLRDNLLAGSDGEKRGIVYSYIAQAGIIFDHNYHYGTPYPYLIEFAPGIKRLQDHTSGNTSYVYPQERDNKQWGHLAPAVSNLPGYAIPFDPDLFLAGSPEAPAVWQRGDDPGYQPIASLTGKDMLVSGAGQLKAVADAHGGETAAEFTASAKHAGLAVRLDDTKQLQEGRVGFIEVELKRADAAPLDTVYLWLVHNYGRSSERVSARTCVCRPTGSASPSPSWSATSTGACSTSFCSPTSSRRARRGASSAGTSACITPPRRIRGCARACGASATRTPRSCSAAIPSRSVALLR